MTAPTPIPTRKQLFEPGAPLPFLLNSAQAAYLMNVCEETALALLNSGLLEEKKTDGYKNRKRFFITQSVIEYCTK